MVQSNGTTTDALLKKANGIKFEALRNAIYHTARRGFLDRMNKSCSFLVILFGAAAVGDLGKQYAIGANWLAFIAAAAGTVQLVADFGVSARNHEFLQRQYYQLIAEIAAAINPTELQIASWEAKLNRIYGEEPPPMRALDAIAYNAACELFGKQADRVKVNWWQSVLRHLFMFSSAEFPYERANAGSVSRAA